MWIFWLWACSGGGDTLTGGIDMTDAWVAEDGRYQVFRLLGPEEEPSADTGNLGAGRVLTETQEGGCDLDRKWRYEIRNGESWTSSDFVTALHFNDSSGLEICGYEEDDGTLMILDPAVELWSSRTVEDGAVVDSGEFSVTASVLDDLVTYYGVFSKAVAFDIEGPVDGLTARLVFVSDMGLVLVRTHEFTADLVYVR